MFKRFSNHPLDTPNKAPNKTPNKAPLSGVVNEPMMSSSSGISNSVADNCAIPAYSVAKLSVHYVHKRGKKMALHDVNLTIPANKITALIGPSGCGKSTFLQSLNQLTSSLPTCQSSGQIRLFDQCIKTDIKPLQLCRQVGMIFQRPSPFPTSIYKNLSIPLKEHAKQRLRKTEIKQQIEEVLEEVGLWAEVKDRLHSSALALSGGQQQRLCIARALILRPQVLLMDEPCSALDPIASAVIEDLIVRLGQQHTIVVVTHNLAQAKRIADFTGLFWVQPVHKNTSTGILPGHSRSDQSPPDNSRPDAMAGHMIEFAATQTLFSQPQHELTQAYLAGLQG